MKFLLVSPFTSTSGSAVRFWNIAHQLQLNGFKVVYVDRAPKNSPPPLFKNIVYYSSPKLKNLYLDIFVSLLINLLILMRHFDCSIFYALKPAPNNCIPALIAKLCGKRIFLDVDDLDYGYFNTGIKRYISKFFFNLFPRYFEMITCHTKNLEKYLTEKLKIPQKKIHFLPQGISKPLILFKPVENNMPDQKSIVYMATLGRSSDFEDLLPMFLKICSVNKDLKFTIIGDGAKRDYFEKKVVDIGIGENISFIGQIEHKEIPGIITSHRIGLNYMRPSFTNNCRSILKIREYLAVGLEVVCNNVGDAELFKEYAYVENSIEDMEKRILNLLKEQSRFNEKGREFILNNFNWNEIIYKFLKNTIG